MSSNERAGTIRIFLAVCTLNSFAAAALHLHLSPSAIAKAVARLEARLGVRLFERTTRRLTLTQEGTRYRHVCSNALATIDDVEIELAALRDAPSGLVRVSLPPLFGAAVIAPALFALMQVHPLLSFEIELDGEKRDLLEKRVDLAVRIGTLPDSPGLTARRLGTQRIVLCASTGYLTEHGLPETITELEAHALIVTSRNGLIMPWSIVRPDGTVQTWTPVSRLRLDGSALTLAAIRAGQGIGLLPEWLVAADIAAGRIHQLLPCEFAGHLPVHAIWPTVPAMLPRLRATIDALVTVAGDALEKPQSGAGAS